MGKGSGGVYGGAWGGDLSHGHNHLQRRLEDIVCANQMTRNQVCLRKSLPVSIMRAWGGGSKTAYLTELFLNKENNSKYSYR